MRREEIDGEFVLIDEQVGKPALRDGKDGPPEADRLRAVVLWQFEQ